MSLLLLFGGAGTPQATAGTSGHMFLGKPSIGWVFGKPESGLRNPGLTTTTTFGQPGITWVVGRPEIGQ